MRSMLRSNFEPGSSQWTMRRTQWRALGIAEEDMEKPKIAVINSSSDLAICFSHLDEVARKMKESILAAGGLPFEIRTSAPSDFITSAGHNGGYILSSRDLIVNDIEVAVEGAQLDGMVCLASCDKTVPAHLMAAARLNIPTLIVACGYQPSGSYHGHHCDIEDVFLQAGHYKAGKITFEQLKEMSDVAVRGPGVCPGMGTANTMQMVCEALGMTLPGTTPVLANSARMWDTVKAAGQRIVEMVWENVLPRDILTYDSFVNAVMTVLSVSGSINAAKHLQAVASEAECNVDVYGLFAKYAGQVPLLTAVRPNGEYLIEDLERAGGTRAVLKQLESFLLRGARTVMGTPMEELLKGVTVADEDIIRPINRAFSWKPTIVLVKGSLCPEYGIVKLAVADDRPLKFSGRAIVYESREDAIEGVKNGEVKPGHVVVLRGLGPRGTPGMGTASALIFALDGAGLGEQVAVITDGQLSGLVNKGIVVGEVSPEAAVGGPLALVQNGDAISIDVDARMVNLDVPDEELNKRRAQWKAWTNGDERGWLAIYRKLVRPLSEGATLAR
ncbi:dihydroxy-acid dehydratase [Alicyclobacillus kakegawensis]|uniref:dihydroxy-acid dehydratase n=1 Tax=Alicyclobacillus kakegawensis TaxID=392012 RepID=UPI00082EA996|nr:dihydroxy-acid dehydratase [Alicyclobacillus kakegawensis]